MDPVEVVRRYYDAVVEKEWERIDGRPEFLLTCRFLDRYIQPGDRVLDIGGGPGRYALRLAQRGCDVTLLDLSTENVRFAQAKAAETSLPIKAVEGDARTADAVVEGPFDHVLLMGPLYHLLEEKDRVQAVNAALRLLKPGGLLFATFINLYAGLIYAMKLEPSCIADQSEASLAYLQSVLDGRSHAGALFTQAFFIRPAEVLPFMARFPLEKLHLFGQEGIFTFCESNVMAQPRELIDAWLELSEKISGREELLSWAEHLMYVGRRM
jgi:S-adenosylmethionine-dependent methyltransferase